MGARGLKGLRATPYWIPAPRFHEDKLRGNDPPEADRRSGVSPRINSLESLFDKEGLREFGVRGLKMEDYQDIRFNVSDGVAVIELHRPEHLNAYSGRMGVELGKAVEAQPDEGLAGVAGVAG